MRKKEATVISAFSHDGNKHNNEKDNCGSNQQKLANQATKTDYFYKFESYEFLHKQSCQVKKLLVFKTKNSIFNTLLH